MLVAEKYSLQRQIAWNDEAEVHAGTDPQRRASVAVKIRHGIGGDPRPGGNRDRFLRAVNDQQAALQVGCRQIAPIHEAGLEGDNAFYVTQHYQRSLEALIQGRVSLDHGAMRRLVTAVLQALEDLRDRHGRTHGNLKPTNIFLDGRDVQNAPVVLADLALREEAGGQAADCYALGTVIFQLVRGRMVRSFDWPIEPSPDWERLGAQADNWREFCNVLMDPGLASQGNGALAAVRGSFKNLRRLGTAGERRSGSRAGASTPAPSRGLLWAIFGVGVVVVTGAAVAWRTLNAPKPIVSVPAPTSEAASPVPGGEATPPVVAQGTPAATPPVPASDTPAAATPEPTAVPATPSATPLVVEVPTPAPTPNPHDRWIGYLALLQQFQGTVKAPNAQDQPDTVTAGLGRLRDSVSYLPVRDDPTVVSFLQRLPAKIEATGDQPDLPANLWTRESASRQGDLQSVTYQWGRSGFRFVFNRVNASGQTPFYLSATTVPVQFGLVLARLAAADGRGPLSGAGSVKGPVAWEAPGGNYALRASWMVLDSINAPFYANAGRPAYDSPMNGLSAQDAVRLARAAGCTLPTVGQWAAVLASPSGQAWTAQWQSAAKVRGPQWAAFARNLQSQHITGAKLPNDQCFGDRNDLGPAGQGADANLFFEGIGSRTLSGYAHLIGNVGQYVVDDARNPTKYYFAGGSAESAPSVFQSLTSPPAVVSPFLSSADGGLRLAAQAKGDASEKNPAFDKLKSDLDAELARVEKL